MDRRQRRARARGLAALPRGRAGHVRLNVRRAHEWGLERRRGTPAELHADGTVPARRTVRVLEATAAAVVLGSSQAAADVDAAAAARLGVDVVRRRSGGGAVWVSPGEPLWVDVLLPRGDPLWDDDVGRSALWLGGAWRRALESVGVGPTRVHTGSLACTTWSRTVCFAGVGAGEVTLEAAEAGTGLARKVVGISQRRSRAGARFQCAVPLVWDPAPLCAVLAGGPAPEELAAAGYGVAAHTTPTRLLDALVEALP